MKKIIGWWSGGITSAVACKLAIEQYGKDNVRIIFMDTCNEHIDTYRFFLDCEKLYDIEIEIITGIKDYSGWELKQYAELFKKRAEYYQPNKNVHFYSIEEVWFYHKSLNVSYGAICSTELKRNVREKWEKTNEWKNQVFGFEFTNKEFKRAMGMYLNHPKTKPIFPLLSPALQKEDCINLFNGYGVKIPESYLLGYQNNNCLGQDFGCPQGGIGYWQKIQRENINAYNKRAAIEHLLTDHRGFPVTMCKDQSNAAKKIVEETGDKTRAFVFLLPHPDYPKLKDLSIMEAREPEPLIDCNGFCGINDLERNPTEKEINYQSELNL